MDIEKTLNAGKLESISSQGITIINNTPIPFNREEETDLLSLSRYILDIYSPICFFPETLRISLKVSDILEFLISGDPKDDGIIIGVGGATIQSVRLLVHAYVKANLGNILCFVKVQDHKGNNRPLI